MMSDLPAHEATARSYAADSADVVLRRALTAVLAELDRVRAVEKAAAALVDVIENKLWHIDGKLVGPLDTLKEALNGETT